MYLVHVARSRAGRPVHLRRAVTERYKTMDQEGGATTRREDEAPGFALPRLAGRSVVLRPVVQQDYDVLRLALLSEGMALHWRYRGATPAPEQFVEQLWAGVLCQFIVTTPNDPRPRGLVLCYNADLHSGFAYVAATKLSPLDRTTLVARGFAMFLGYVFDVWAFRKVYAEVPAYNLTQFSSAIGSIMKIEGQLRNHRRLLNRYWDEYTLAIDGVQFHEKYDRFLEYL